MTRRLGFPLLWAAIAAAILTLLFALYQHPLMEIYLANWALC